ncbi:MAG: hypothetical protein EA413_02450 [Cyanobium sp. PLM2.Bin73]|jgi:hypothetical protein|nr:MAG: hypothetical protein EA413_02450 [Cyanobium sp. PLM2.Bin73]
MSKRFFDQLQAGQQPLVSYRQQQQWPNQGADAAADDGDEAELDSELDLDEDLDADADAETDPDEGVSGEEGDSGDDSRARALQAERQKNNRLEREIANRERQLQLSADRKLRTVAKERDEALRQIDELRKERLLERLFVDAEGRPGGDNRGSFFEIFKQQVGAEFRLEKDASGRDALVPIDSKGNPLLGDDGQVSAADHVESLRTHPATIAEIDGNGNATNLQAMSPAELYRASYACKPAGSRN